ncbi:integrase catalytic domain-containing protein [Trichonephila clavipes]|nr:integrase catalytic domain-containing protein [Trichonephila clavipes]
MQILPEGRYELCLPFKSEAIDLSSNKDLTWKWRKKIITTKIRPVFDASACATGQSSLNDLLYKGPNLIEQIPDILDMFRRYPIGPSADIEKAFLQLGITPKHRDFFRFFYNNEDNCVTGVNNISQQEEFVLRSKEILSRECFNLRNWESNVENKTLPRVRKLAMLGQKKARVVPLKQVTIPRLELMACCIGARLAHSVQESLNITEMETVFWSDLMVTLYWLREKGGCSVFVSNRIKEIKNLFPNSEWRHVPGKINPDDLISRECSPSPLVESHWWEGPLWLVESPDTWPITKLPDYDTSEISLERKKVRLCNLNLSEEMLPWIKGGRRTVRKIWNDCVKCRRFKSKSPMTYPVSLLFHRVKDAALFEVVGVDLAGSLYVKRGDKVWIVLYTCAINRALHLELVSSLSTDAFLLSFCLFVARRGRPLIVYSDNGTNFRGAYNELVDIDWNEVSRYAEILRITWKFIPPTAAWWGGFWERLVRAVNKLLRRTLGKAIFTY